MRSSAFQSLFLIVGIIFLHQTVAPDNARAVILGGAALGFGAGFHFARFIAKIDQEERPTLTMPDEEE